MFLSYVKYSKMYIKNQRNNVCGYMLCIISVAKLFRVLYALKVNTIYVIFDIQ